MNASKRGTLAITKEEYKKDFINAISNLNDIIYVDMNGEENQYVLYFKENPNVGAFYRRILENELGKIPGNSIVYNNDFDKGLYYRMIHEIKHSEQKQAYSDIFILYDDIIRILREGNSNYFAEYIRDIRLFEGEAVTTASNRKYRLFSITNVSENAYKLLSIIYNKLSYLIGERELDEYFRKQDVYLHDFLSEKLDEKYGEGTGLELYQSITNLSFWSISYYNAGVTTQEKLDKIREEIIMKNKIIKQELEENEDLTDYYNKVLTINNNYYEMLNAVERNISEKSVKSETDSEELTMYQRNIELKKLENLTLRCINKDIENISSKNEALDYIQLWDYYRNRCAISKNIYNKLGDSIGKEETSNEDNFKRLTDVQHNLYKKCIEYGALNIQSEQVFDKMLEAQLYDLSNASIIYEYKGKRKLIISDQYLTNESIIEKKKDGSREFSDYKQYRSKEVKGTKILAEREKEKWTKNVNKVILDMEEEIIDK